MNVQELINKLSQYPTDMKVYVSFRGEGRLVGEDEVDVSTDVIDVDEGPIDEAVVVFTTWD